MAELIATPALYRRLVGARIRSQLQYRTQFALNTIGAFLGTAIDFLVIAIIFGQLPRLAGWTLPEVALLYGISGLAFGLCDLVVGHLDNFGEVVRTGAFDQVLIRPLPPIFQIVATDFQLRRLGKIAQAVGVLAVALPAAGIDWTVARVGVFLAAVLGGAVIFTCVWLCGAAVCFWTADTTEINNAFTYGGNFLTSYPLTLYGVWLRRLLAFAIPMAFITYYPALYLLDRPDPLGGAWFLGLLTPVVALATIIVTRIVWWFAVRHYTSTGS